MSLRENWRVLLLMAALVIVWHYRVSGDLPVTPDDKEQKVIPLRQPLERAG